MDTEKVKRLIVRAEESVVKIASEQCVLRKIVDELESLCDSVGESIDYCEDGLLCLKTGLEFLEGSGEPG